MPGTVALLCTMIGTTTFDGFSNGPVWSDLAPDITDVFADLGFGQATALQIAFTARAAGVSSRSSRCCTGSAPPGMRTVAPERSDDGLARTFVHSLAPIALAYAVAHYFSLLAYQGQALAYLASNPLGRALAEGDGGLFGTADWGIDYTWVGSRTIWYVQVGALVLGHVAGLVLAHDRALEVVRPIPARRPARNTGCSWSWSPSRASGCGCSRRDDRPASRPRGALARVPALRRAGRLIVGALLSGRAGATSAARRLSAWLGRRRRLSLRMSCASPSGVSRSTGQPMRCMPSPSTSTTYAECSLPSRCGAMP